MNNNYEYVLMYKKQQVCLFKIPPISTAKGHYLDDWKEMFWEGGCKLVEKAGKLELQFVNTNDATLVAFSQLPPQDPYQALQKTVDSQRGFAVRLLAPNGAFQWVGCVFRDRNDAFDLTVQLQDFLEQQDRLKNPQKYQNQFKPEHDWSLKEGSKIQISLGEGGQKSQKPKQQSGLGAFKLEAPPDFSEQGFGQVQPQQQQAQQAPVQQAQTNQWQGSAGFEGFGQPFGQPFGQASTQQNQNDAFSNFNLNFSNFSQGQGQVQGQGQQQNSQLEQQQFGQQQQGQQQQQQQQQGGGNTINLLDL